MTLVNLTLQYTVDQHPNAFWINISPNSKIAELKSVICVHPEDGPPSTRSCFVEVTSGDSHKALDLLPSSSPQNFPSLPHETIDERVQAMNLDEIAVELKNDNEKFQKCRY